MSYVGPPLLRRYYGTIGVRASDPITSLLAVGEPIHCPVRGEVVVDNLVGLAAAIEAIVAVEGLGEGLAQGAGTVVGPLCRAVALRINRV